MLRKKYTKEELGSHVFSGAGEEVKGAIRDGLFQVLEDEQQRDTVIVRFSNTHRFAPNAKLIEHIFTEVFWGVPLERIVFNGHGARIEITAQRRLS